MSLSLWDSFRSYQLKGRFDQKNGILIDFEAISILNPTEGISAKAMIDTGAEKTCLSKLAIEKLGMLNTHIGISSIIFGGRVISAFVYVVDLTMSSGEIRVSLPGQPVSSLDMTGAPFSLLIGRDIILKGSLKTTPKGFFSLALPRTKFQQAPA